MHGHYVLHVFVFGMDRTIRICGLNAPGVIDGSTLADYGSIYEKLEKVLRKLVVRLWWIQPFVWPTMILL
jgi:hypothetical protein